MKHTSLSFTIDAATLSIEGVSPETALKMAQILLESMETPSVTKPLMEDRPTAKTVITGVKPSMTRIDHGKNVSDDTGNSSYRFGDTPSISEEESEMWEKAAPVIKKELEKVQEEKLQGWAKKLPIQGQEHRTVFPSIRSDQTQPQTTRMVNGQTTYRSRYECPSCGDKGLRYIWPHSSFLKCHKCNHKIAPSPVVPKELWENHLPVEGNDGYFFIATKSYEEEPSNGRQENAYRLSADGESESQ